MSTPRDLIDAALAVSTREEFDSLRAALAEFGANHERPVGDLAGNLSVISATGEPEHLVLELVTNAQDAVLERRASAMRQADEPVPLSPRKLAAKLGWPGETKTNQTLGQRIRLSFRDSGFSSRPTISCRDHGIGVATEQVRKTILSLSQAPKDHAAYLLGNYGKGGSTMYRDGRGAVLVGRPSPEIIRQTGCEDRVWITLVDAVHDEGKVERWTYAVTTEFDPDRPAESGDLLSFPAAEVDFEPGVMVTHVAYAAPGLGEAKILRDRKSIYVLGNTRLFDPVLPWSIVDSRPSPTHDGRTMYGSRSNFMAGKQSQLPGSGIEGSLAVKDPDTSETYEIPITVFLFEKESRWSATAADHVVVFTSHGQVQAHWAHNETRNRTALATGTISGLRRVAKDVLFVDVVLDHLPPRLRSRAVSADRTRFTDIPVAKAIQEETARWLAEQPDLQELEKELSLDRSRSTDRLQVRSKILDEIARRLGFKGQPTRTPDEPRPPKPPQVLLDEPTQLSGNATITLVAGKTRTVHFSLNARDGFLMDRVADVELEVEGFDLTNEPRPSSLRRGRFSVEMLAAEKSSPGKYAATAKVSFLAKAGGRKTLEWPFKITLHDTPPERPEPPRPQGRGGRPVVEWADRDSTLVGDVSDELTGTELAELFKRPEYAELGDQRVTLIEVNKNYLSIRKYLDQVAQTSGDRTVSKREDRYVVGVAVALSRVLGVQPGSPDDKFHAVSNGERHELVRLAADGIVASLPPVEGRS